VCQPEFTLQIRQLGDTCQPIHGQKDKWGSLRPKFIRQSYKNPGLSCSRLADNEKASTVDRGFECW